MWSSRFENLIESGGHCSIFGLSAAALASIAGGAISAGGSVAGGKKGASAATQAANVQAAAAMQAANLQQARFEQIAQTLQPFIGYGQAAMGPLQALTGTAPGGPGPLQAPLTRLPATWQPTQQQLAQMPGYQFQLQQGTKAAQAATAAAGLGRSGATGQAVANFASGLAGSNWMQNFQQFLGQQNLNLAGQAQTYNMLTGQVGTGLQAAGALGGVGIQSAAQVGNALQAAGAAQAGGLQQAAQFGIAGLSGATSAIANPLMTAALASQLQQAQTGNDLASVFATQGTQTGALQFG